MKSKLSQMLVVNLILAVSLYAGEQVGRGKAPLNPPKLPPQGTFVYSAYKTDDLVLLVDQLGKSHRLAEAVAAGQEALSRPDRTPAQDAVVRWNMAQMYEFLPDCGKLAREKYAEVLQLHPDYVGNIAIAYRLGELNNNIILKGTERNVQRAVEYYGYVVTCCNDPKKVYYWALESHLALAYLYGQQGDHAGARQHLEVIYESDPQLAEPLPHQTFASAKDLAEYKEWLRTQTLWLKGNIPAKLVANSIRPDFVDSIVELGNLRAQYSSDPKVVELSTAAIDFLVQKVLDQAGSIMSLDIGTLDNNK
jgi:tetratricopeptide (TPR) repeat protein